MAAGELSTTGTIRLILDLATIVDTNEISISCRSVPDGGGEKEVKASAAEGEEAAEVDKGVAEVGAARKRPPKLQKRWHARSTKLHSEQGLPRLPWRCPGVS